MVARGRLACWQRPEEPGSNVRKRGDHPVVHISHADAGAYASWAATRLPTNLGFRCVRSLVQSETA